MRPHAPPNLSSRQRSSPAAYPSRPMGPMARIRRHHGACATASSSSGIAAATSASAGGSRSPASLSPSPMCLYTLSPRRSAERVRPALPPCLSQAARLLIAGGTGEPAVARGVARAWRLCSRRAGSRSRALKPVRRSTSWIVPAAASAPAYTL